jgi:DNA polymerase-3 subunit alpha
MDAAEALGLVKFDLLTLRTLDTIQQAVDLIRDQRGDTVDVYSWKDEYEDPQVWEEISDGHTLGIFQIETSGGTRYTKRFRPQSLDELSDLITLVRPGPKNSGLTETYFRRKMGEEEVSVPDPRLEPVLASTYGCMIYQEQVINICRVLGGYTSEEADDVRRLLGKKKVEQVAEAGRMFIARCVENDTDREVAVTIWEQMAEFAKYSFNRSHAYGYAMLGYWTAWLKFHYPVQFLCAVLSTVDKGRIPEFINEARRMGYQVLPPDINTSGKGFSAGQMEVRYGFDGVKGVGDAAVEALVAGQPYTSWEDFLERKGSANAGIVKTLAKVGTFDSLVPNRRLLEQRLEWETDGSANRCLFKDESVLKAHGLPCTFDWDSEPAPIGKRGQALKKKPLPKKCSRACRNWTAPVLDLTNVEPYTAEDIMEKEMELLGVHLSSTPFDRIPDHVLDECSTGSDVEVGGGGEYLVAGLINKVRTHVATNGKEMAFLGVYAQDADLDVTVFNDTWVKFQRDLKKGLLCFMLVRKNDRGLTLSHLQPL